VTCSTCGGNGEVRRATRSVFGQFVSVSPCPTCAGEARSCSRPAVCRGDGGSRASAPRWSKFRQGCRATTTSRCAARVRRVPGTAPGRPGGDARGEGR
jgi:DnaJ-class molecular chaperone